MSVLDEALGFDFHCHVDLDRDPTGLIRRCEKERIFTLAVTTTPKAWPQNRKWTAQSPFVFPALGLHPELVAERHDEIVALEAFMPEGRFIGEVGLDGSLSHRKSLPLQQEIFARVLRRAQELGGRVVTIHSRWAAAQVIESIERDTTKDRVLCILHWFSGTPAEAKRAIAAGCFFSVNKEMLGNERGRALVKSLPPDRLLTETDSPFTKTAGRSSLPTDVIGTADMLANLGHAPPEELKRAIAENARRVLAIAGLR